MHFCVSGRKQVKYVSLSQPVCMDASTLPVCIVFKGSEQMWKKGNSTSVWWETQRKGLGNISSFLLVFFIRSVSSGLRAAFGWSHDVSWYFLYCVSLLLQYMRMWVLCQAGQIRRFKWGSCRHEITDNVAKMRLRVVPQCPATLCIFYHSSLRMRVCMVLSWVSHAVFLSQTSSTTQIVTCKVEIRAKVMFWPVILGGRSRICVQPERKCWLQYLDL